MNNPKSVALPTSEALADPEPASNVVTYHNKAVTTLLKNGIDPEDRRGVLGSAAVAITCILWRNTEIENVHAVGWGDSRDAREWDPDASRKHYESLYKVKVSSVCDKRESRRNRRMFRGLANGYSIPDDVMLRLNCYFAECILETLDGTIPDDWNSYDDLDAFSWDIGAWVDELAYYFTKDAEVQIGCDSITLGELLGPNWEQFEMENHAGLWSLVHLSYNFGDRTALALLAGAGSTAFKWFPGHQWERVVEATRQGELETLGDWTPNPHDNAFWQAATTTPYLLNYQQSNWLMCSQSIAENFRLIHAEDATLFDTGDREPLTLGECVGLLCFNSSHLGQYWDTDSM